ncbi:Plasmodium exported protein, unknown function [Plasmodium vivax]|nr:Plasmodium exported protein, unknown function [Plasmodium vivax]
MAIMNKNTMTKEKMNVFFFFMKIFSFSALFWILSNCSYTQGNRDARANDQISRTLAEQVNINKYNDAEIKIIKGSIADNPEYADFIETPIERKANKTVVSDAEIPPIRKQKPIKRRKIIKPGSPEAIMKETKTFWNKCKHTGPCRPARTGEHLKDFPKKFYLSELKLIEDDDDEYTMYDDPMFTVNFRYGIENLEEFKEKFIRNNFQEEDIDI